MDHHPFSNKIKGFFLSEKIKLRAQHYLETLFALLVLRHLVNFMFLLKATDNTYPPKFLKNFHNKSYENKPKISKITKT
jgi:hypothetical protein